MVVAGGNLADPADGIALVADVAAIGVADADQAVAAIVAVAGDVGLAQFGFALFDEVAVAVVAVGGHAAFVLDAAQTADTVVTLVVRVGNVVGFARIVDAQQTVQGVIAVAGGDAAGIGTAQWVTGRVMGVGQTAAIRAVFVEQVVEAVALVVGPVVFGIGDAEQVVGAVVVVAREAGQGVLLLDQPVQAVIAVLAGVAVRIDGAGTVAVVIILVGRGVAVGVQYLGQPTEAVEAGFLQASELAVRVFDLLFEAVAQRVQTVVLAVAQVVGDGDQPVRGIVAVVELFAAGQADMDRLAGGVIVDGRGLVAFGARQQPAARMVGQFGDAAVGIDDFQRMAVPVVGGDAGRVAQGIGDGGQVAFAVVTVAGAVVDIGARAVSQGDLAVVVIGEGPAAA